MKIRRLVSYQCLVLLSPHLMMPSSGILENLSEESSISMTTAASNLEASNLAAGDPLNFFKDHPPHDWGDLAKSWLFKCFEKRKLDSKEVFEPPFK